MKNTMLADIVLSAQAAANEAHAAKADALTRNNLKLEAFGAGEFDRADYETFEQQFNQQLDMLAHFSKQPSPATVAASRQSAAIPSPAAKAAIIAALALLSLFMTTPRASAQIVYSMTVVSNIYAAPVQLNFQITSNLVTMPFNAHSLLLTNLETNVNYTFGYGSAPLGASSAPVTNLNNITTLVSITTNFTAAWCVSVGYTNGSGIPTNNFPWAYIVPNQYATPALVPWGFYSGPGATNPVGMVFQ